MKRKREGASVHSEGGDEQREGPGVMAFCAGRQRWRRSWPGSGRRRPSSRRFWSRSAGDRSGRWRSSVAELISDEAQADPACAACAGTAWGAGAGRDVGHEVGGALVGGAMSPARALLLYSPAALPPSTEREQGESRCFRSGIFAT